MRRGRGVVCLPLAVALLAGGCSDDDESSADGVAAGSYAAGPTAADTFVGSFAAVGQAGKRAADLEGTATMVLSASGTEVAVDLTGLNPAAAYVAHVHNAPCAAEDPGGGHYQFDPAGGDQPPNELHLSLTVAGEGRGTGRTTNAQRAGPDAKSVVVHLKRAAGAKQDATTPPKLACADLTAA